MRIKKRKFSTATFGIATVSSLVFFVLFILIILASLFSYTNLRTIWAALISDEIIFAVKLSLLTSTISTAFCMLLVVPAAYALSRVKFPGKTIVDALLDLPLVLPPIGLGLALLVFFSTPLGRGIESSGVSFVFERPGIILAQFAVVSAFALRLMKSAFDTVGSRYEKIARTLGCNSWQAFFWVVLPLVKNSLLAATILTWTRAMGEFGATVTLAGAMKMKTEVMSIAIFLNIASFRLERAIAAVLILFGISVVTLVIIRWAGEKVIRYG